MSTQKTDQHPSPRAYTSIAYNSSEDRVIMFGGSTGDYRNEATFNNETWVYDYAVNRWTKVEPLTRPGRRSAIELVYDSKSDRIIMFGGAGGLNPSTWGLADTWTYDYAKNTWTEMSKGPANHLGARLSYDSASGKIILFGGFDMTKGILYNDTWVYEFKTDTWVKMKPKTSPPGRNYQAMTYDSTANRVLIWGGFDLKGKPVDESMWCYDYNANTWIERKPEKGPHPQGREYPRMIYALVVDRTILFGGHIGGDETWSYDFNTNSWTKLKPAKVPGEISRHAMVYNSVAERIILFGGQIGSQEFNYTNETWAFDTEKTMWAKMIPSS